jgi:hypothetical protein
MPQKSGRVYDHNGVWRRKPTILHQLRQLPRIIYRETRWLEETTMAKKSHKVEQVKKPDMKLSPAQKRWIINFGNAPRDQVESIYEMTRRTVKKGGVWRQVFL